MDVTIYDLETGIIQQHSTYPDHVGTFKVVRAIIRDGLGESVDVVRGHIDADAHRIRNRRKVKRAAQPPKPITSRQVKAEAERRILSQFPLWKQMNMIRAGEDLGGIDFIRQASNRIEAMEPIPQDFTDDKYWLLSGE